jgi:starch-binding outer membrane protein, SusD/RagB family
MKGQTTRWLVIVPALAVVAVLGAACDINKALRVESPTRIPAESLESPANAALLVNGAVADFECAFGAFVAVGGLIGEELDDYTQTADRWPYDRRDVQSRDRRYAVSACDAIGVYTPLQSARVSANNVVRLLQGWTDQQVPNRQQLIATATAYEAWSILLLGEMFCSTVLSTIAPGGEFNFAGEIARRQALQEAETRFTSAIDLATQVGTARADSIRRMALLGRARTRLDLGNSAGARADAAQIPAGFVFNVTASAINSRRNNRLWAESNAQGVASSVSQLYRSMNDPRVPYQDLNRPNALGVPAIAQLKYTSAAAPIPLARYDEAQLIIAEVDAASAATAGNALTIINTYRARGNQGPYLGPTDAASLRAQVIDQRRRELFLEGTHFGDLVRYNITPTPGMGTNYPAGGQYGTQKCTGADTRMGLPLPDIERQNNPELRT